MANIILPQVNILNEIDDSTKLIVEQNGEINRYPITDLELGGGDVTIDLSGDNAGKTTGVNATLLGGYPAEDYAKVSDIDNMLEIDLYGASAAEPNLVNADTLGGFGSDYFASAEEMNKKLSMKLLWENASPTSDFAAQTITLDLSQIDFVKIIYKTMTTSVSDYIFEVSVNSSATIINFVNTAYSSVVQVSSRDLTINSNEIIFGDCANKQISSASAAATLNSRIIPIKIYGVKGAIV